MKLCEQLETICSGGGGARFESKTIHLRDKEKNEDSSRF